MSFQAYLDNIQAKTGKSPADFRRLAEKKGFANPFARMGGMRPGGGGAFAELMSKTAEANAKMGKGIAVKTLTSTTSTNDKGEVTKNVATMEMTELKAGDVDDALFVPPAGYEVMDMGAQTKAMAEQMQQAKAAQAAPGDQADAAHAVQPDSTPSMKEAAKKTAEQAAKDAAASKVKKGLGGLFRRP